MKVAVLLADGFETLEGLTVVDVMRRADVCCHTFGTKSQKVRTSHNVVVEADKLLSDEVLDMLDYIVVAGKTVCNSGGKSPNTVLMPYLKQTTHSLEVLEKCHVEIPLMSGYYIPEAHIEEAGKDITDIIDSDKLFDEKRAELKAEIKYREKYENVECPFMTDLQETNEILAKILVSEDKRKSETDGGYFTKVMGFLPDLGFENLSVIQQIKGYVDNLYKEFLELAA